jgi:Co/Zn/Cd efflux system component
LISAVNEPQASNIAVLLATLGVWLTSSHWPDLVVGALLAVLFLRSAIRVLTSALQAQREAAKRPVMGIRIVGR